MGFGLAGFGGWLAYFFWEISKGLPIIISLYFMDRYSIYVKLTFIEKFDIEIEAHFQV